MAFTGPNSDAFTEGIVESDSTAIQDGFVNLPDGGVMVGVQPPAHPTATTTVAPVAQQESAPAQQPAGRTFTEADIARARKEEKDKLYAELEGTKATLKELQKAERARAKAEEEAAAAAAAEANRKAEEEMEFKALLDKRTEEFNAQLVAERESREQLAATLERERQFAEATMYKTQRIDQERDNILPELINLVSGNTPEEIEASIASLRGTSESIISNIQNAQMVARQSMQGASVTAPPVGPMETQASQQSLSPDQIRNLSNEEYAKHRDRLLGAMRQHTSQNGLYQ